MPLVSAHYYISVCWLFLWEKGEVSKCSRGKTHERLRVQSCTSVVAWLVFLAAAPCLPQNADGDSSVACSHLTCFLFLSLLPHPPSSTPQEPVCQQKPSTSPCAYQTVYPFPVGAVLHLWLWQPVATLRVHSKPWFRHLALPELLCQPPVSPRSCDFLTTHALVLYFLRFPRARAVEYMHGR